MEDEKNWQLVFSGWNPEEESFRESLCTLGNGRFATRGAAEESPQGSRHHHGTYFAGLYDRGEVQLEGGAAGFEILVNWPNWLPLSFRSGEGWLDLETMQVLGYRQTLDLRRGLLERRMSVRDAAGRDTEVISRRMVSQARSHLACLQWLVRPLNWSGKLHLRSGLDGCIANLGSRRYQGMGGTFFDVRETGSDGLLRMEAEARSSRVLLALACRTSLSLDGAAAGKAGSVTERPRCVSEDFSLDVRPGNEIRVDKVVALHTFHILQTASPNSSPLDAGVPARGLHGPGYLGHVFWDEVFVLRYLNLRLPAVSRSLLMYRYHRLPAARALAREAGLEGALYPWRSGSDGREATPAYHRNPRTGQWVGDATCLQRHINSAVAHDIWDYYLATGDREFLRLHGAEMFLEIARFWADIAEPGEADGRYDISGVVGPDEFHTRYPGARSPGLKNNAYTNAMASWVLGKVPEVLAELGGLESGHLLERLGIDGGDLGRWNHVSRNLRIPFHGDGIISQFEGYGDLLELDWGAYRRKYGDIRRLDDILGAEGDSPDRYKASKQADALMLFYMLPFEEVRAVFRNLGYALDEGGIRNCVEYYMARTSNGSTLSGVVHAWVRARMDRRNSWDLFREALRFDWEDSSHGTTGEGVHLGAMAGTLDLIQRCYGGLEARRDALHADPDLPEPLAGLSMPIRYRGVRIDFRADREGGRLSVESGAKSPIKVVAGRRAVELPAGGQVDFANRVGADKGTEITMEAGQP